MAYLLNENDCNARLQDRRVWVMEPDHSEHISASKCYLYHNSTRRHALLVCSFLVYGVAMGYYVVR